MSEVRSGRTGEYGEAFGRWPDRPVPARRAESGGISTGWLVAGVAAVALGYVAWRHFGPDFRRYLKMERM